MNVSKQIHIGHEIEARINELKISKSEFARRIGTSKQNVTRILERESIDTSTLAKYGEALDFNFFNLYADALNMIIKATDHSQAAGRDLHMASEDAVLSERIKHLEELLKEKDERIKEKDDRIAEYKQTIAELKNK